MKNKFFSSAILALPLSFIFQIFEKYIFSDWEFVGWLVVVMVIDTVLGFIKHWITHDVSSKAFGMIAAKIIKYCIVMIVSNIAQNFTIYGEKQTSLTWFSTFCCTMLIVREVISIVENTEAILPGTFPKWVIKRLNDFDSKTGEKV